MKTLSKMGVTNGILITLLVGLMVRIVLAVYTTHAATWAKVMHLDELLVIGGNPFLRASGFGFSFYFFYIPPYVLFLILSSFGIQYEFVLVALLRIPPIIGDVIAFYSLYEITLHFSKDRHKSLLLASAFFLNPYTIWMSSIIGHAESLMMGFVLLSFLYLFKRKIIHSAIFLGFAANFRNLPLLLLPYFIIYVWAMGKPASRRTFSFLAVFSFSVILFASPFVLSVIQVHLRSQLSFVAFMQHWLGSGSAVSSTGDYSIELIKTFMYNFTGIFATIGVWPQVAGFFGFRNFLIIYSLITVFFLKYGRPSPLQMNQYAIITYSLFMLMTPLVQHHYMMWIFPFVSLAAFLFDTMPKHFFHLLWITNMLIEPIVDGNFFWYLDLTFPSSFRQNMWPFRSLSLELSISALHAMLLLFTISISLTLVYSSFRRSKLTRVSTKPILGASQK